jgi:phosphatidylglycerophosphatase A
MSDLDHSSLKMESFGNVFLSFFGAGYLPKMPGTWGSIAGLIIAYIIMFEGGFTEQPYINGSILLTLAVVFTVFAIPLIDKVISADDSNDPSWIVIDEVAGIFLALAFPPFWVYWWLPLIVFFLFRFFDIAKPFPVSWADNKKGGLYVMLDDIIAGALAFVVGFALLYTLRLVDIYTLVG